jgi:O-methyltransferase
MQTLLGNLRQEKLKLYVTLSNYIDGNLCEIGVFKGGSAEIIAKNKSDYKKLFLFDTFEGLPEVSNHDNFHKTGDFNDTSFELVKENLSSYKNIFVYKGMFPQTNSEFIINEKFSLVHIDVDIYQSYKDCLEFFYPKMVIGGLMILDDYNASTCIGAKVATDEFFKDKPEKPVWTTYSQVVVIKI